MFKKCLIVFLFSYAPFSAEQQQNDKEFKLTVMKKCKCLVLIPLLSNY